MTTQHGKIYQMVESVANELILGDTHEVEAGHLMLGLLPKIAELEPVWIPVSEKPSIGKYLTRGNYGVCIASFSSDSEWIDGNYIIPGVKYYMPIPPNE